MRLDAYLPAAPPIFAAVAEGYVSDETAGITVVFFSRLGLLDGLESGKDCSGTASGWADVRQTILDSFVLILTGCCDL